MYSISNIPSQAAQDIRDLYALGVFHRSLSPCRPHIAQVDHRTQFISQLAKQYYIYMYYMYYIIIL